MEYDAGWIYVYSYALESLHIYIYIIIILYDKYMIYDITQLRTVSLPRLFGRRHGRLSLLKQTPIAESMRPRGTPTIQSAGRVEGKV